MDEKRQWTVVTALIGVAVLVAGYMFFVRPEYGKAHSADSQAKTVAAQTKVLETKLATLQAQQGQLKGKQDKLAALQVQVPPAENLADLTTQLQAAADNLPNPPSSGRADLTKGAHVDMSVLTPAAPAALTASPNAATASADSTAPSGTASGATLMQVPLTFTVSGTFFNLESFLDRLENLKRALIIDNFTITFQKPGDVDDSIPNSGELTVNISARAFMTTAPLTGATAQ